MLGIAASTLGAVAVDLAIVVALVAGLLHRSTRRWRGTLTALTAVATFNLAQSIASMQEAPGMFLTFDRLLHAAEVLSFAAVVFTFRREISRPTRLLERANARRSDGLDFESLRAPIINLTRDGVIQRANQSALDLFATDSSGMMDREVFALFGSRQDRASARQSFMRFVASGGTTDTEYDQVVKSTAGDRLIRWRRTAQLDRSGLVVGVISYGEDITEHRAAQDRLKAESYLLDSVHDAVLVTGADLRLLYFNRAAHEMLGVSAEEFGHMSLTGWLTSDSLDAVERHLQLVQQGRDHIVEALALAKDGRRIPVELRSQLIEFDGQAAFMSVFRDVSSKVHARELMEQMAFTDALTGLPNRRTVQDRIGRTIDVDAADGKRSSILYLDVDNLKRVNDTLGHAAGDQLVVLVAERLASLLRKEDMIARVGGDEFVIVLPQDAESPSCEEVAQRLLDGLAQPMRINGQELRMSASIGIASCDPDLTPEQILVAADRAMYAAKRSGGRRYFRYSAYMDAEILERFTLQNELSLALEADELRLHFQPIVDSLDYRTRGAEALVRWQHPQRGLLAPSHFIEIAEGSGLIREIGTWVLRQACRTLSSWRAEGLAIDWIAVNVSPLQLVEESFTTELVAALDSHGLGPNDLQLEITETQAMEYSDQIAEVLDALNGMGVRLALDDFGVGHSSLERLRRLPISTLKLDRTFVADISETSNTSHPIIDTVLVLGSNLGLTVVAEGVETVCQADYLVAAGCQKLQGYAFAKPMTADLFMQTCRAPLLEQNAGRQDEMTETFLPA